jgi:hypothetical protein
MECMKRSAAAICVALTILAPFARAQKSKKPITVPLVADAAAKEKSFHDSRFGVSFRVPPGWEFTRKDGEVSTFHADARSAPQADQLRAVATLSFNPFPRSTLSGALFYYSVEPHSTDVECAQQASGQKPAKRDLQDIGGMTFTHGHDESGMICTEARDEIYTAYRKGACYRFDLAMNSFCGVSSGAQDLNDAQFRDIEQRLTGILSTVVLGWEKAGATAVPLPQEHLSEEPAAPKSPEPATPAAAGARSGLVPPPPHTFCAGLLFAADSVVLARKVFIADTLQVKS